MVSTSLLLGALYHIFCAGRLEVHVVGDAPESRWNVLDFNEAMKGGPTAAMMLRVLTGRMSKKRPGTCPAVF
tara:strand:+ start:6475 stop:6690 length:216 start_codon:yes stop_codon:yes gene_type:complete